MSLSFNGVSGIILGVSGASRPFNLITSYPFSISCWFFPTNTTGAKDLVALRRVAAATSDTYWLGTDGLSVVASTWNGSISVRASRSGININRWNHAIARFNSNTQRFVHINGSDGTINTTSSGQFGQDFDALFLGVADGGQRPFTGYMAHVAIWNESLSNSDSASLGRGMSPFYVRPQNLVAYYPIVNPGRQINIASAKSRGAPEIPTLNNASYSNWNPPVKTVLPNNPKKIIQTTAAPSIIIPNLYRQRQMQGMAA